MIFEFESAGEGKVLNASDRVVGSLGRMKESYRSVAREVGILRRSLNFAINTGFVGGAVASQLASLGQVSAAEKKQLSTSGSVGSSIGAIAGLSVGSLAGDLAMKKLGIGDAVGAVAGKAASRAVGSLAGSTLGRVLGTVVPVVGSIVGSLLGEALGAWIGEGVDQVFFAEGRAKEEAWKKQEERYKNSQDTLKALNTNADTLSILMRI